MALVGVELQTLVSQPDALTTRLPLTELTLLHVNVFCCL